MAGADTTVDITRMFLSDVPTAPLKMVMYKIVLNMLTLSLAFIILLRILIYLIAIE